nr:hypothetical protein CFP56_50954 [Quercus suber]
MSYHFAARADSSSSEDGIDLAAWKAGSTTELTELPQAPNVPDEDEEEGPVSESHQAKKRKTRSPSTAPSVAPTRTFQAVNQSSAASRHTSASGDASEPAIEELISNLQNAPRVETAETEETEAGEVGGREVWVNLPPFTLDRSEYEDFTAGADSVAHVLKEIERADGELCYEVQFEDGDTNYRVDATPIASTSVAKPIYLSTA